MNHHQRHFPAYRAFRVNFHIKITLEEFPCVVCDVNSKAAVNPGCHSANEKDKTSHQRAGAGWAEAAAPAGAVGCAVGTAALQCNMCK